jgi:hypothetical protein
MNASNTENFRPAAVKQEKPRAEKSDLVKPKQAAANKTVEPASTEKVSAKKVGQEKPAEAKVKKEATHSAR